MTADLCPRDLTRIDMSKKEDKKMGAAEQTANEQAPEITTEELLAKIEELERKIKDDEDKYLRMAAEYDNFRRRSREEREGVYESALADTVSEILPIIDNLERAAMYEGDKVKDGIVMISKSVGEVLTKLGVEEVGKVGEVFDPNLHNAVMHEDDDTKGEGEITEVFQKGYKKGKRVIRFAMVKSVN